MPENGAPKLTDKEILALPDVKCPTCGDKGLVRVENHKIYMHKNGYMFIPVTSTIHCFNCKQPIDVLAVARKAGLPGPGA